MTHTAAMNRRRHTRATKTLTNRRGVVFSDVYPRWRHVGVWTATHAVNGHVCGPWRTVTHSNTGANWHRPLFGVITRTRTWS